MHNYLTTLLILFSTYSLSLATPTDSTLIDTLAVDSNAFTGQIKLKRSNGVYGFLFEEHISLEFSENKVKREERLGNKLNKVQYFKEYVGVIIDFKLDEVTLYFSSLGDHYKHVMSIDDYKEKVLNNNLSPSTPNFFDNTFTPFTTYAIQENVPDSSSMKGFKLDYSYTGQHLIDQNIMDAKELNVPRRSMELIYGNLPTEINFPMRSETKTIVSDFKEDAVLESPEMQFVNRLIHQTGIKRKLLMRILRIKKIRKDKWVKRTLKVLKYGIDFKFNVRTQVDEISPSPLADDDIKLPENIYFEPIENLYEFLDIVTIDKYEVDL